MRKLKKTVSILLSVIMAAGMFTAVPLQAGAQTVASGSDAVNLKDGAYVPNQVVVKFKDSAIDTQTMPGKGGLEPVGADFGDAMDASSSKNEALSAADEEIGILKNSLGDDFTLEDSLVFDETGRESGKAGESVGASASGSDGMTIGLISSDKYDTKTLIEKLSKNKNVEKVEPNYVYTRQSFDDYSLNDEYASYLYQVASPAAKNTGGDSVSDRGENAETALSLNAPSGWNDLTGDEKEVVVAVIDSGVLDTHEDLKDMMWTNPGDIGLKGEHGYDFAYNTGKSGNDDSGHGTHCAGIIAAQANNLKGVSGIASAANIKIMALKVMAGLFGSSTAYATYGAFNYIHKAVQGGVNVVAVNASWGGTEFSDIYDEVIDLIGNDGVITYIAAGNDGENTDSVMVDPANTDSEYAITVGAAGITGDRAAFSNYGKASVDIFGAGENIFSTVGYKTYYPSAYSAEKFNATTEYYGEFSADTKVVNGVITPTVGDKAGEDVKSFGEIKFVKQKLFPDDVETVIADDARLELSVESGRHFIPDNPYRLKVTVKDAQPGEEYFIYFPYEKNALTTSDNTYFSISGESVACPTGGEATFYCGEVSMNEDSRYQLTGRKSDYEPGGSVFAYTFANHDKVQRHSTNILNKSEEQAGAENVKLLSAEDAGDKELGFGLYLGFTGSQGSHDLSVYIDSLAISKPNAPIDEDSSYDVMSGTSMACPSVCGGGALISALNPRNEGESGGDYARRIRTKVLSCATQTDALRDYCSTGGYLDLSKIGTECPAVSDAVCDIKSKTITLKGENLVPGSTVTYRNLYEDGAQEQPLPEGMSAAFSPDFKQIIIRNAESLFSTYTEFTVTNENGAKGSGKFFLVKGQNQLTPVSSEMKDIKNLYSRNGSDMTLEVQELVPPYLLTDADGKALYGYIQKTGELAKFDGKTFNTLKNSDIVDSLRGHLKQSGLNVFDVYNNYTILALNTDIPANENGVVYVLAQVVPNDETGDDDSGDDDSGDDEYGDDESGDEEYGDDESGEEDYGDGESGEEEYGDEDMQFEDDSWYLGSFDLNEEDPQWRFTNIKPAPSVDTYDYSNTLATVVNNGKLYVAAKDSESFEETAEKLAFYSFDIAGNKWTREADIPFYAQCYDMVTANGKIYAMFGCLTDTTLSTTDRLLNSVYCYDGGKWTKKIDVPLLGRVSSSYSEISRGEAITSVRNGMIFAGLSANGCGNVFLYNTRTNKTEPLYYTTSDSLSDTYMAYSSCVSTCDGIYYIRQIKDDFKSGWALSLLPKSSGAYNSQFAELFPGDVDGDGLVTIEDATMIQKAAIDLVKLDKCQEAAADYDGDGRITIMDVTAIQRVLAGILVPEDYGKPSDKTDALSLWTRTAPLKSELTAYMKAITDEKSADYIPVENRIAVFDMDGTLCCETDPGYFDHKLLYHRVMEDPDYKDKASDYEKEVCADIKEYFDTGVYPKGMDVRHGTAVATAFKGMTPAEFDAYVKAYRDAPMNSYTNMTNGQAFYKPMLQVVDYLQANDFKVYIVSGTDRLITRGLAEGMINIPLAQMIGSDESLVATGQGDKDGLNYTFTQDDQLITGGDFIIKNLKMNKVTAIEREIGLQPVLCFGNSSGDAAMANYTITNNKYRSGAFLLCCDDLERENGNLTKAESMRESCEKNGWTAVSMKNDWTTIYGDDVQYVK